MNVRVTVMVVLHIVGAIGLSLPAFRSLFVPLIPFHLLLICALLWWDRAVWTSRFLIFILIAYCIGFSAEMCGINLGFPFGNYQYSSICGPKWWNTPWLIGLLWASSTYASFSIARGLFPGDALFMLLCGSLILVGFDFMIEPFAIRYGLWQWQGGAIPDLNYYSWFMVGLGIGIVYRFTLNNHTNAMAPYFLLIQLLFFMCISLLNKYL